MTTTFQTLPYAATSRTRAQVVPPAACWDGGMLTNPVNNRRGVRTHNVVLANPRRVSERSKRIQSGPQRRIGENWRQFLIGGLVGGSLFLGLVLADGGAESATTSGYPQPFSSAAAMK
ncbi:hypothetical protein QVA66_01315 [Staphylococcus chromogenes]|nr:hypothetical protein [Staphylococcus chromogenes]